MIQIGVVAALLNYNLKGTPLSHSIKVADAKIIIFDAALKEVRFPLIDISDGDIYVNIVTSYFLYIVSVLIDSFTVLKIIHWRR